MLRNLFFAALAALLAAGIGYAAPPSGDVVIFIPQTPPSSGKQMYMNYCAGCHGVDGKGNGPVAASLRTKPADLTTLSQRNGGRFPAERVSGILRFGMANQPRSTAEMPAWGPVLGEMDTSYFRPDLRTLRISNLSSYLKTLQEK